MISVILHGACGHMGRVVSEIASADPDVKIVAGVDAFGEACQDFPVYRTLCECTEAADVIVDFSTASAVDALIAYGTERSIPMVICTTGLSDGQVNAIREASGQVAILPPNGFDPEIIEEHHRRKLDAPSGTALMLAESIAEGAGENYTYTYGRHERMESRNPKEIGISSVRGGTIVGVHDVLYAGQDEVPNIAGAASVQKVENDDKTA